MSVFTLLQAWFPVSKVLLELPTRKPCPKLESRLLLITLLPLLEAQTTMPPWPLAVAVLLVRMQLVEPPRYIPYAKFLTLQFVTVTSWTLKR